MDNGDAHPMNIDDESDDSVEEIGKPTQSEGVASTSRLKKWKRKLISELDMVCHLDMDVFKYVEPDVTHITRNTTYADMLKMHGVESKRLHDELLSCPSRICLTSDAWTIVI
ncbi:hypothetical protein Tco_0323243 [Tanacetum coccineum]